VGLLHCYNETIMERLKKLEAVQKASWLNICHIDFFGWAKTLPDFNPLTCKTGLPICSFKNIPKPSDDYCQMVRYTVADFYIEVIFSFLSSLAWLFLVIRIHKTADELQRKKTKL